MTTTIKNIIAKQVERLSEAIIVEGMSKEDIWIEFSKKMSRPTFERRWKLFQDKSATYYKRKQMNLIGKALDSRKKMIKEAWDLYNNKDNKNIHDLKVVEKMQGGLEEFMLKCGIIDAAVEKIEHSGSVSNDGKYELIVNFPEGFKVPKKKSDIK